MVTSSADIASERLLRPMAPYAFNSKARSAYLVAAIFFAAAGLPFLATHGLREPTSLAVLLLIGLTLFALTIIDLTTLRLPNALTAPLIFSGVLFTLFPAPHRLDGLLGAAFGYGLLWLVATGYERLRGRAGLGLGDAKLLAAAGAWLGVGAVPTVLLLASLSALAWAIVMHVRGLNVNGQTTLAFGPFLAFGFWLAMLYGPRSW